MAWAPDYAEVADLAEYMEISDSADNAQLALSVSAASRAIDQACNRQFGLVAAPESRYYTARWDRYHSRWVVQIDDLMTTVGLLVNADLSGLSTYSDFIDEYALRPVNAGPVARPWTELHVLPSSSVQPNSADAGVEVTARFGWTAVPTPIVQACLIQASRFHMRRNAPFGIAGSPDAGSEMRLLAKVDPDVYVSIRPYVRQWGCV